MNWRHPISSTHFIFPSASILLTAVLSLCYMSPLVAEAPKGNELRSLYDVLNPRGYGSVSMELTDNNQQFIKVSINGHDLRLLIDTGCARTSLTRRTASELNLTVHDTDKQVKAAGGLVAGFSGQTSIGSFKIGGYEINRVNPIYVLPSGTRVSQDWDGLLGFDYMKMNSMVLPVGLHELYFKPGHTYHAGTYSPPAQIGPLMRSLGFTSIPLHLHGIAYRVNAVMNGRPMASLIDSGATFTSLDLEYANKIPNVTMRELPITMRGADGGGMATLGMIPSSLSLGGFSVPPVGVAISRNLAISLYGFDALIGYDIIGTHFGLIDFGNDTLWMR